MMKCFLEESSLIKIHVLMKDWLHGSESISGRNRYSSMVGLFSLCFALATNVIEAALPVYVFGITHVPWLEDWPVMPAERIGFMLMISTTTLCTKTKSVQELKVLIHFILHHHLPSKKLSASTIEHFSHYGALKF
ncbi:copper methylamine oxidase [Quercus suber]|uniref:Copper methylamine oxidase n=1 Tax=Quercus suber TaxID=58331 RepID=A0AAW0LXL2_QUESU